MSSHIIIEIISLNWNKWENLDWATLKSHTQKNVPLAYLVLFKFREATDSHGPH